MTVTLEIVFWTMVGWLVWVYAGYPVVIHLLSRVIPKSVRGKKITPSVSVLIAAYNEVDCIAATIANKLEQDYPEDCLEIIVVSDASDDGTDQEVAAFEDKRVRMLRQSQRQGKTAALNRAAAAANGDVLLFSDANSLYEPGAIRALVSCFADSDVGYVTGKMIYGNPDGSVVGDGCTGYMRYENWLRYSETQLGSIVGVDGGIDAVRTSLYQPMRDDQLPDFVLPLSVVLNGFRVVYQPQAILKETALSDASDEFRMRVRVSLRALWALWDMRALLNPFVYPLFSFQLLSHKVLRYLAFIPLLSLPVLTVGLLDVALVYVVALLAQTVFWFLSLVGWRGWGGRLAGWPFYLCALNLASAVAFTRFIRGKKQILWQPRGGA